MIYSQLENATTKEKLRDSLALTIKEQERIDAAFKSDMKVLSSASFSLDIERGLKCLIHEKYGREARELSDQVEWIQYALGDASEEQSECDDQVSTGVVQWEASI